MDLLYSVNHQPLQVYPMAQSGSTSKDLAKDFAEKLSSASELGIWESESLHLTLPSAPGCLLWEELDTLLWRVTSHCLRASS